MRNVGAARPSLPRPRGRRDARQALVTACGIAAGLAIFLLLERIVTPRYTLALPIDARIPFIPWSWAIYIGFFPFVIALAARAPARTFAAFQEAVLIVFMIGFACFLLFPEIMHRPDPNEIGNAFLRHRLARMWRLDLAANGFPSLHVAITWLACRMLPARRRMLAAVAGAMIIVSTLTLKQHTVIDVLGGALLAMASAHWAERRSMRRGLAGSDTQPVQPTRFAPDRPWFRTAPWRAFAALAGDWALIALAFAAAARWPHPLVYAVAALVIARSQLALAVMMHEAAHGSLMSNRRLNDALGQLLAAAPLWLSLRVYRAGHLKHHRAPMAPDDPVAVVFGIQDYPLTRPRLIGRLLAHACGIGYITSIVKLARGDFAHALPKLAPSRTATAWEIASMLIANGLLAGALALAGHPLLYLGLWIAPSITLLPLIGQVRAIFEHAGLPACADQSLNARTIIRPSWQTFLFGPHAIHYHIEHHLYPRMPFHRLAAVHQELARRRLLPEGNLYTSYGAVLRDVTR